MGRGVVLPPSLSLSLSLCATLHLLLLALATVRALPVPARAPNGLLVPSGRVGRLARRLAPARLRFRALARRAVAERLHLAAPPGEHLLEIAGAGLLEVVDLCRGCILLLVVFWEGK